MNEIQKERERCAKIVEEKLHTVGKWGPERFTLQEIVTQIRGKTCVENGHSRGGSDRRCYYCNEELEVPKPSVGDSRYASQQ